MNLIQRRLETITFLMTRPHESGPALSLSRKVFKNNAGWTKNLVGRFELLRARNRRHQVHPDNHGILAQLNNTGLIDLPDFYSKQSIERIAAYSKRELDVLEIKAREKGKEVNRVDIDDKLKEVFLSPLLNDKMVRLVEDYYRSSFKISSFGVWRIFHAPAHLLAQKEVYSNRWHSDSEPTFLLSLFVNLSNVGPNDGPF